jgi:hypothetical protein
MLVEESDMQHIKLLTVAGMCLVLLSGCLSLQVDRNRSEYAEGLDLFPSSQSQHDLEPQGRLPEARI